MKLYCPLRLADPLLLNFLYEYFIVRRITFYFSSFNYIVNWVHVAIINFCLTSNIYVLTFFRWASVNKESASSEVYVTKIFLVRTAQAFLILNAPVGAVSKAPLQNLAESVLPADSRFMLVAWASLGKPTVFRRCSDFLRLFFSLLFSKTNFRQPLLPEVYDIA